MFLYRIKAPSFEIVMEEQKLLENHYLNIGSLNSSASDWLGCVMCIFQVLNSALKNFVFVDTRTTNTPQAVFRCSMELQFCYVQLKAIVHLSVFYTHLLQFRVAGGLLLGERRGALWTGRQTFTGPHRKKQPYTHTLTPRVNLESLINRTCMFLYGRRMSEYPERTHACMSLLSFKFIQ